MRAWHGLMLVMALDACTPGQEGSDAGTGGTDAAVTTEDGGMNTPDAGAPDAGEPPVYTWQQLTTPSDGPVGRWAYIVAELGNHQALLFGGTTYNATGGALQDDTWLVDVRSGEPQFTRLLTTAQPSPRYCGCATYDSARNKVILVGGRAADLLDTETWEFDLETSDWTEIPLTSQPGGGLGCAMAYSPDANATYLYGGAEYTGSRRETWRYDAAGPSWTILDVDSPNARYDSVFRHVAPGQPMLLFGGSRSAQSAFYKEVWRFDVNTETWTETEVQGELPGGRRVAWMVMEPDASAFLMGFGVHGLTADDAYADLWRFDLARSTWQPLSATGPSPRGFAMALPGGPGHAGLLLGGYSMTDPLSDLWRLEPSASDPRWN
ncbi:MAG: kelch repeat-containing protein [Myxococcota bacterium]